MKQTPLFTNHLQHDAHTEVYGDWTLVARFGAVQDEIDAARRGAAVFDLAHLRAITLSGEAVARWVNGMFTQDFRQLRPGRGGRAAMCDDRGRVEGLLHVAMDAPGRVLVALEGITPEAFEERYRMFLMLDDIELEADEDGPWLLSVQGPEAAAVLGRLGLPVPEGELATVPAAEGPGIRVLRRDRTGLGGFDLWLPADALEPTWDALRGAGATPAGIEALEALRVAAGIPRWPEDGDAITLVHELRLERELVSFTKGCYVGQETINRLERRGGLQKRLGGLVLAEDALPPRGAEVILDGEVVGSTRSAARIDGRALALAMLRKAAWEPGLAVEVRAGDRTVAATTSDLPFAPAGR